MMTSVWVMALRPPAGVTGRGVIEQIAAVLGGRVEQVDSTRWAWIADGNTATVVSYDEPCEERPDLTVLLDIYAANASICSEVAGQLADRLNEWPGCEAHANLPEFRQDPSMLLPA